MAEAKVKDAGQLSCGDGRLLLYYFFSFGGWSGGLSDILCLLPGIVGCGRFVCCLVPRRMDIVFFFSGLIGSAFAVDAAVDGYS